MKVNNSSNLNQVQRNDQQPDLQTGEIVKATVKEKLPNNEAIVQVKGKSMQVKVEGSVAKGDNVTMQVTDTDGKIPGVKVVPDPAVNAGSQTQASDAARVIRGLGETPTNDLKMAVALVLGQGLPIDKSILGQLKLFMEKGVGTVGQKLDAIRALLNKQAPITMTTLQAVNEALNGDSLKSMIQQLLPTGGDSATQARPATLIDALDQSASKTNNTPPTVTQQTLTEVNTLKQQVASEPNFHKALMHVKKTVATAPGLTDEIKKPLQKAIAEAEQFQEMGRSQIGRNVLIKALDTVGDKLLADSATQADADNTTDSTAASQSQNYLQNEAMQAVGVNSKDILITQVTRRLGEAAESFKNVKREIVRNLDNLEKSIPPGRINVLPQVKPLLESTIDMLDRTILKSDVTMFTDMSMEKTLMSASGQLSQARKLLAQGDNEQASQLVNEVKQSLDKLTFKPTITRVQHFLTADSMFQGAPDSLKLSAQAEQLTRAFTPEHASARSTFEFMRSLGLNHESEVAQALVLHKDQVEPQELQKNLKATMLQIMKQQGDLASQRIGDQPIDKAFMNLTGQQILNKTDTQSSMQSLFFNLPVMLGAKVEDVKVFVNGRKEGEKIDWENCSCYFLLETKKLGETGIMLTSVSRNLSVSIRNDAPNFKETMQPLVDKCRDRLKEIGYNITSVQFDKLTQESAKPSVEEKPAEKTGTDVARFVTGQKGFDFKA
ncbi:hypothetical protein EDM56_00445 [Brevibacillus fluminis]|uniref:Flagellar hook-length control protein FliK n=1 Tax=Brevibacillus fluminis TaxID=511487 RepID=A0A3M8DWU1_9BACL|nr:hypothetical protein [Brevibacillus fluminis]RNB92650.1 hypothetical protein EDM56_00445 [Brevibacillus fluminis]